jgi:23S rRNA (guanosine2251-2'-O)-methyltransferase
MKEEWIHGIHVVHTLLQQAPERILEAYILESRDDKRIEEIKQLLKSQKITTKFLDRKQFESLTKEEHHQGVLARIRPKPNLTEHDLIEALRNSKKPAFILVLDNVQDPHNLGACLRTADAAGVHAVIIPKDRSAKVNATVRKVASGAAENVPIVEATNLVRCLEALKKEGVWVIGTTAEPTETLFQVDLKGPIALVLGAEGTGMRRLTAETCDSFLKIPMFGVVESLNVSVAASICLYEAVRQRLK